MRIFGKLTGILIGGFILGPLGAVFGLLIGHFFDLGQAQNGTSQYFDKMKQARKVFFQTTFAMMGYLAKVDGRVSEKEISSARASMEQLGLTQKQKLLAIEHFNYGKSARFDFEQQLNTFRHYCGQQPYLIRLFVEIQIKNAMVEHFDNHYKQYALEQICNRLNVPRDLLESIKYQMNSEKEARKPSYSPKDELANAYTILGVTKEANHQTIKKAYKQLVSQNHPDKLVAKGLPEEMMKLANEKMQSIQRAYQTICLAKGIKK